MKTLIFVCGNFECPKLDIQVSVHTEETSPLKWCLKCGNPLVQINENIKIDNNEQTEKLER